VPKMFLHAPQGAFTAEARARVAAELTELGMTCERLIDTPQIRAGIWVYFVEHAPDTLKGGFNAETKTRMVAEGTAILGKPTAARCRPTSASSRSPKRTGACMASRFTWRRCRSRHDLRRA